VKILAAQVNPTIGDLDGNAAKIIAALKRAKGADVVLFPELVLSGYFPDDLLLDSSYIDAIWQKLQEIVPHTKGLFAVIGLPRINATKKEKPLYNSVAICIDGVIAGFKNKTLLPTYDVFDERRFFESDPEQPIWEYKGKKIGISICEDAWQHTGTVGYTDYNIDPVLELKKKKPDLFLNCSASPYYYKRTDTRQSVFQAIAKTLQCPVVLCNQVGVNDQVVFDGHSLYINEKAELVTIAKGFEEDDLIVDLSAKTSPCKLPENGIHDLYAALVLGVRDYFHKQGFQRAVLGLSGGIDSTVTACIAVDALGASNVLALNLPSRHSSKGSVDDSAKLAKNLQIEFKTISIDSLYQNYLDLLSFNKPFDLTEENLQSRIRAMILMAHANKFDRILLTTGDKSEMAMGFTTLYGDMAGGLGVLHDVTKTHVYDLAKYINRHKEIIPKEILEKPPSPELRDNQLATDTIPKYEILDPIIEDYIEERLTPEAIAKKRKQPLDFIQKIIHTIHSAEYKRRQTPISIRVTQKAFNKGRQVPIVQKWK
jgi:NAD+ synthase (glutamine-hydrolysing)